MSPFFFLYFQSKTRQYYSRHTFTQNVLHFNISMKINTKQIKAWQNKRPITTLECKRQRESGTCICSQSVHTQHRIQCLRSVSRNLYYYIIILLLKHSELIFRHCNTAHAHCRLPSHFLHNCRKTGFTVLSPFILWTCSISLFVQTETLRQRFLSTHHSDEELLP